MIRVQNTRDFTDCREPHVSPAVERSVGSALYGLVKYELGFGGVLATVPADSFDTLRIRTRVFHNIDTVTYKGPEDEMMKLHAAVYLWYKVRQEVYAETGMLHDQSMTYLTKVTGGLPLLICNFHEQIMLGHIVPVVILSALGLQDEDHIKRLAALYEKGSNPDDKNGEFKSVVELLAEGTPVEDVLDVAGV
jgi:hypothetical protein